MSNAVIFDIQKCSFVDGPGIRTVVFFKGCNLRCAWCHNPESWTKTAQLAYFSDRCTHCGLCAASCPAGAIDAQMMPDPVRCLHCGLCEKLCPAGARKLYGKTVSCDEIMREIRQDQAFYTTSGGGVTFSGGECLLQIDAVCELAKACRQEGISVAIDTAGNVPWETIEHLLGDADYFLYDLKAFSAEKHRELTGASNERILSNYQRLWQEAREKLMVRIPFVPGMNDCENELKNMANWLGQYPPVKAEILPYHRLGVNKAKALRYASPAYDIPDEPRLTYVKELFREKGIQVQ